MNSKLLWPAALVLLALVAAIVILAALDTGERAAPAAAEATEVEPAPEPVYADLPPGGVSITPRVASGSSPASGGNVAITSVAQALVADTANNLEARGQVFDLIDDAMVTYDIEGLKTLSPLLSHPDPAIREAAIEGIAQLGVVEGAKKLREAARRARTPNEAVLMNETADFLELPEYDPSLHGNLRP